MTHRIAALCRYPVKSMLGEDLDAVAIDSRGVAGDRAYAVIDPAENRIGSAKIPRKWARLYDFRAAYPQSPDGALRPPVIAFADGTLVPADDPGIDAMLSRVFGRAVRLVSEKPDGLKLEAAKPGTDPLTPDETVDFPLVNPFFDFAALHLVTTATLDRLRSLYPGGDFDPRRFRPNIVIETPGEEGFVEQAWVGQTLALGPEVRIRIFKATHRCAATTLPHHGLPNDPEILRTAERHNGGNVGVAASVVQGGTVRVGDEVRSEDR